MLPASNDQIIARMAHLETQNRHIKRVGAAFAVVLCVVTAGAAMKAPSVVVTEKLILIDKDGKERARLETISGGYAALTFCDENGRDGLRLVQSKGKHAALAFAEELDKDRLIIQTGADGSPQLTMFDEKGQVRLALADQPKRFLGLQLFDKSDKLRGAFSLLSDGAPTLFFTDHQESTSVAIGVDSEDHPSFKLFEKEHLRGYLGIKNDGTARMSVSGDDEKSGAVVQTDPQGTSHVRVLDKEGNAVYQAPAER